MKIESSTVGMTSQHASLKYTSVEESLRAWVGPRRPDFEGRDGDTGVAPGLMTVATISDAARQVAAQAPSAADAEEILENQEDAVNADPRMQLLIGLIEALTGQKVRLFNSDELKLDKHAEARLEHVQEIARAAANPRQGWGVEYDRREIQYEAEHTSFAADGIVRTSDGKEIRFSLSLEMKREFLSESSVSVREGDAVRKDPLVINFDGNAAQLSDMKFEFDLDADGNKEMASFVSGGSGFLALDKSGNGVIDDGTELFGAQSGNGFADLSAYDSDGNQWIDENDAVFSKLQVWRKDGAGNDQLSTLAQSNVGALFLGNISTPFDLKDGANQMLGQVRSSGVYLREDDGAGTLQQIDMMV